MKKYRVVVPQIGLVLGQTITHKDLHSSSAGIKVLEKLGHIYEEKTSDEGKENGS